MDDSEVWYEVEFSVAGADDWFIHSNHDSLPTATEEAKQLKVAFGFDTRVIRVTHTKHVVEAA